VAHHASIHPASTRAVPRACSAARSCLYAGKSSLLRALSGEHEILVEDRLFATLDTLTRVVDIGEGYRARVTDTVGFIRKLPHQLVASFRATLEEAALTTKIKAKMALDDVVKARSIDVTTRGTTVTLSGVVESKAEHDRALALARETEGVKDVIDNMKMLQPVG
jgi:hypothetical protein